jgi:hypothetical protein
MLVMGEPTMCQPIAGLFTMSPTQTQFIRLEKSGVEERTSASCQLADTVFQIWC